LQPIRGLSRSSADRNAIADRLHLPIPVPAAAWRAKWLLSAMGVPVGVPLAGGKD
jgi:hypothetical protein